MERQDEVGARAHEGGRDAAHEGRHHRPLARTRVDGVIGAIARSVRTRQSAHRRLRENNTGGEILSSATITTAAAAS